MYEQPPAGHRVGPALVALLVALAATAGTFGYLVTRRVVENQATGVAPPGSTNTADPPGQTNTTGPSGGGSQSKCPDVTVRFLNNRGINADLQLLFYVRAQKGGANYAQVWICKNADGLLIYQGHDMRARLTTADGRNSLLLADGIKGSVETEGSGYNGTNVAGDKSTEYRVSREVLEIRHLPQDVREEYPVVEVGP